MGQKPLFDRYDVVSVLEHNKILLKAAYENLQDAEALDSSRMAQLKAEYMLDVPVLKTDQMSYVEGKTKVDARRQPNRIFLPGSGPVMEEATELTIHIPFEGDSSVFDISPSAYNSRVATGEIVGQELLLKLVVIDNNYDIQGHIDREITQINWALTHLREKEQYFSQELGAVLAQAVGRRKRAVETRTGISGRLNIPQRPSTVQPEPKQRLSVLAAPAKTSDPHDQTKKKDIFLSHASEDKLYVEPLAKALEAAGITVWYDNFVLEWGDDLRPIIDKGLAGCRYGVVILSKAFLGKKKWTEHELNGLFAREQAGKKLVLPIWHGITRDDLLDYSPALADRLAKISENDSNESIVASLLKILGR